MSPLERSPLYLASIFSELALISLVFASCLYQLETDELWQKIELSNKADVDYSCIGGKASNYIMLHEVFGEKGSGGGGWMHMNQ